MSPRPGKMKTKPVANGITWFLQQPLTYHKNQAILEKRIKEAVRAAILLAHPQSLFEDKQAGNKPNTCIMTRQ